MNKQAIFHHRAALHRILLKAHSEDYNNLYTIVKYKGKKANASAKDIYLSARIVLFLV